MATEIDVLRNNDVYRANVKIVVPKNSVGSGNLLVRFPPGTGKVYSILSVGASALGSIYDIKIYAPAAVSDLGTPYPAISQMNRLWPLANTFEVYTDATFTTDPADLILTTWIGVARKASAGQFNSAEVVGTRTLKEIASVFPEDSLAVITFEDVNDDDGEVIFNMVCEETVFSPVAPS